MQRSEPSLVARSDSRTHLDAGWDRAGTSPLAHMIRVIFPTRLGLLARPLAADEHADLRIQDPQGRVMKENSFRLHRVWPRSYR